MTGTHNDEPRLLFFRYKPTGLITRPPLASSLQHLETSFLLVSMGRYPHALVTCGSAIESAIKAAINASPDDRLDFRKLINKARQLFPLFTTLSEDEIRDFRLKRNEIIHFGFSPKDDEISAVFLLKTGYSLIEQCYEEFFQFPLQGKGDVYGGLLPDLAHHLNVARKVYIKAKEEKGLDLTYCFISFAHAIRWGIQHWMMSDWQKDLLHSEEEGGWASWEFQHKQKEELSWKTFDISWHFDCPVCGDPDSFICELDDTQLDKGKVSLKRGACVNCGLVTPKNCPFLVDELCAEQFDEARPKILKEYGIA